MKIFKVHLVALTKDYAIRFGYRCTTMKKYCQQILLLLTMLCAVHSLLLAQKIPTEALQKINKMAGEDKVIAILDLIDDESVNYVYDDPDQVERLLKESLTLSQSLEYAAGIKDSHYQLMNFYKRHGNFVGVLEQLFRQDEHFQAMGTKEDLAENKILIGNEYKERGNLIDALKYYLQAKSIFEELGDVKGEAQVLGSIGLIYINEEKYNSAIEYLNEALKIFKNLPKEDDEAYINQAITYGSLGRAESYLGNYSKALEHFNTALEIDKMLEDPLGVAYDYFAIAEVMEMQNSNHSALKYIQTALETFEEQGDEFSATACKILEGKLYRKIGLNEQALDQLHQALETAHELDSKPFAKNAYEEMSKLYENLGETEKAFAYYKKFIAVKDSITSSEKSKSIEDLRNSYEVQQKTKENTRLRTQVESERNIKYLIMGIAVLGALFSLSFLFVIISRYRIKQKANRELEKQKDIIETNNEKMMGSIRYGRRIQKALLASGESISQAFPESFVFLKPKDIVSGDFFWYVNRGNEQIIAAIDCTGHGVPGAFMTVFGYSLLNRIVNNDGITEPSQILAMLGLEVMKLFQTKDEDQIIRDGMDMAVVKVNRDTKELQFAGAGRPLVLQTAKGQQYIKGDRVGLGGKQLVERGKPFTTFTHPYEQGDTFYIFSDGYQDQFGGPQGRKFMSKNFKRLLNDIQTLSMKEQEEHLEQHLKEWMGEEKQTDDMIVIGVKITE